MENLLADAPFLLSILISVGVCAGLLSGIFGIGGGVVLVPAFFYTFSFLGYEEINAMHLAVATSLCSSVPATLSSFRSHWKKNNVDFPLLKVWAPAILGGVFFGAYIATLVEGLVLLQIFSVYLIVAAFAMLKTKETKPLFKRFPPEPWRTFIGFFIGALSSLLGIGGGTITVPKMALFGKPMKQAVGTAAAISTIICLFGAISHAVTGTLSGVELPYTVGYVNWIAFLVVSPVGILSAKGGAFLAHYMNANVLRIVFALFLSLVGVKMIIDSFQLLI